MVMRLGIVVKSLARLLKQRLRETDIVGRYGGDEFYVIFK
jgi:diguanylate cyclase (GGDEF)-like protein